MKRLVMLTCLSSVVLTGCACTETRAAETMMSYYGNVIRDPFPDTMYISSTDTGTAVTTGKMELTFELYSSPIDDGTAAAWHEHWPEVEVAANGDYYVLLGSHEDLDTDLWEGTDVMYLTITPKDGQPTERKPIFLTVGAVGMMNFTSGDPKQVDRLLVETINKTRTGQMDAERAMIVNDLARTLMRVQENTDILRRLERLERKVGIGK